MTLFQIFVPKIKDPDQKGSVICNGKVVTFLTPCLVHRLQTGNELQKFKVMIPVKTVNFFNISCIIPGHNTQNVILHMEFIE